MATQDMTRDEEAEYRAAFEEDMQSSAAAPEDDALGINPSAEDAPAGSDAATEGEPAAVALVVADADAMAEAEGQANADTTVDEASAQPGEEDEGPLDPKEEQRRKSWEGRLRAREEELARREAELAAKAGAKDEPEQEAESPEAEAIEKAADKLAAEGDEAGAEAVEEVADKVESGELSADQAMKILAEDFGPEFVKMIEVIAASKAQEAGRTIAEKATGELRQSVTSLIEDIEDRNARAHFETIADKHPDFNVVATTPEFAEFVKGYENGDKIAQNGTAKQVIKMLDDFKAQGQKPEQKVDEATVDAAEGVRSRGMQLPEPPMKADGYEDAWNQF